MKSFITLEEALNILDYNTKSLELEEIPLLKAIGRTSGENIFAAVNVPLFNKSAMDGYAIIAEESMNEHSKLKIIDEIMAGDFSDKEVTLGTAIRIMTGAPIPKGATGVIKQENVIKEKEYIKISKPIRPHENVCFIGEDIKKDNLIVRANKVVDYADIGVLASVGVNKINVYRRPKVAFISTGNEVIDLDQTLEYGKIYNSNKYSILGRIVELGYEITYVEHESDNEKSIGEKLRFATKIADIVITTGGASVGEKDLIKEAIDYIGGEKLFWKILIKPGSSMLCSKLNNKLIISLSGNPTAALTTFELIAKPAMQKLSGKLNIEIKREKAILANEFMKKSPQRRFLRGNIGRDNQVTITQLKTGNGILSSTLNSNCLIEIEKGNEGLKKGDIVSVITF